MKYKTTEAHFDWEKVGFGGFTGDMCRQKWQKVSCEVQTHHKYQIRKCQAGSVMTSLDVFQVRKYRTMTELIVDAIEFVKNPYKGKKLKVRSTQTKPDPTCGVSVGLMTSSSVSRLTRTSRRSL